MNDLDNELYDQSCIREQQCCVHYDQHRELLRSRLGLGPDRQCGALYSAATGTAEPSAQLYLSASASAAGSLPSPTAITRVTSPMIMSSAPLKLNTPLA